MDRQIDNTKVRAETKNGAKQPSSYRTGHLMCRTPFVTRNEYEWPHDFWTAATYIVWVLLLAGLALDTRCLRERVFFGLLVINFVVGCGLTLWSNVPPANVRSARIGTGALWAVAALVSLTTLGNAAELRKKDV